MMIENGVYFFGYFNGMEYNKKRNEPFELYKTYVNKLPKDIIIRHIESLEAAYAAFCTYDIFTGEMLPDAGLYDDGKFRFPIDFLYYYKKYDIGIPPEYEKYLIEEVGLAA